MVIMHAIWEEEDTAYLPSSVVLPDEGTVYTYLGARLLQLINVRKVLQDVSTTQKCHDNVVMVCLYSTSMAQCGPDIHSDEHINCWVIHSLCTANAMA
jgi:hypothetical protein